MIPWKEAERIWENPKSTPEELGELYNWLRRKEGILLARIAPDRTSPMVSSLEEEVIDEGRKE